MQSSSVGTMCTGGHQHNAKGPSAASWCAGDVPAPLQQQLPAWRQLPPVHLLWTGASSELRKLFPMIPEPRCSQALGALPVLRVDTCPHAPCAALGQDHTVLSSVSAWQAAVIDLLT